MSEMVERVARAIFEAMDVADGLDLSSAERYAQAAIEAMREPTEAMIAAVDKAEQNGDYVAAAYEHIEWNDAWVVAIDEALK